MPQVTGDVKQQQRDNIEDSSMHKEGISSGKLSCCKDKEVRKLLFATRTMEDAMEPTDKSSAKTHLLNGHLLYKHSCYLQHSFLKQ